MYNENRRGSNSMVESQPSKLLVASSILVSRSIPNSSRIGIAIVFGAMACIGLSQSPADVEQTFGSFLSAVAAFDRSPTSRPAPRAVIGLTEPEAQFLNAVATEW